MNKLEKIFVQGQVLTAAELNTISSKVDEIVELLSSLDSGGSSITDAQVLAKVNAAKLELRQLLENAVTNLLENINNLREIAEGATSVVTESEWAEYRSKIDEQGELISSMIQLLSDEVNITSLREKVDELNDLVGSLHIEPGKLEILAALVDEEGNLIIDPAAIIAAIIEDEETGRLKSVLTISANNVILDGDVTLTSSLTALSADLLDLSTSTATIKDQLTALSAEIGNKTDNSDFQNLVTLLGDLSLVVNGKAAIEDLTALTATIGDKVDNSDFQNLVTSLGDLALVVNGKAAIEDLTALSARIDNLDVPDTATIANAVIQQLDVPGELTGKTITGATINGGSINIGNGNFTVDDQGNVIANSITLNGQGHCILRQPNQLVTLPDPRPGTIVTVVNETPYTPSSQSTTAMILTKDTSTQFIRYFVANGTGAGSWSRASSSAEDSKLPAWIVEQIVYILLVANGTNWYVTSCLAKDGQLWPGNRSL